MSEVKTVNRKSNALMAGALMLLMALGLLGSQLFMHQYQPVNQEDNQSIDIVIPSSSSTRAIAALLKDNGLIRNERVFVAYCRQQKIDSQMKAGHYRFARSMSLPDIAQAIAQGKVVQVTFTIPEGYTVVQIGELLTARSLCTAAAWEEAVKQDYDFSFVKTARPASGKSSLEGFLFPDTYVVGETASPQDIIRAMLNRFEDVWKNEMETAAQQQGRNVNDVVVMASLVEEEARIDTERATIAGVIWNRLQKGMMLQIDATVLYSLNQNKPVVTYADLKVESPYNTYLHAGLPPGPIACPGQAALQAALHPEKHNYYYYIARGDGSHHFSATYAEHLQAQRRYTP